MAEPIKIDDVKVAARGRWVEILTTLGGLTSEQLDPRKNQPCPKCGGTDRFNAFRDVAETGGVNCRHCHAEKNGDGISTLQWATGRTLGKTVVSVAEFLGLSRPAQSQGRLVRSYNYVDEAGTLLYQVMRYEPKDFRQQRPDGKGGWIRNLQGVRLVPYRLPQVLAADPATPVFLVEGEKDADAIAGLGLVATCNSGGAKKWKDEHTAAIGKRLVVILPDGDAPGRAHADMAATSLMKAGCRVKVAAVPVGKDAADWIASGATKADFLALADKTPEAEAGGDEPDPDILPIERALRDSGPRVVLLTDAMRQHVEAIKGGGEKLLSTGIAEVDAAIAGGIADGEMVVVAARPSHGKSAIALQFVHNWTERGIPCAFLSEEMATLAVGKRALQYASPLHHETWRYNIEELHQGIASYEREHAPMHIIEACGTVQRALVEINRLIDNNGVKCVVIDYAQLLGNEGKGLYEKVTATSMALRNLASHRNVVVVVLCQLGREVENRDSFVPRNSDIKQSGQLEQDADVILHLCWHHRIKQDSDPAMYTIFVGKNRNREIVSPAVELRFEPSRQRVVGPKKIEAKDRPNFNTSFESGW